jgi:exosortase
MIPLPWRLANAIGAVLQRFAIVASTYVLQTLGYPAFAEGNVIHLGETNLGVVESCSGLSMLLVFIAFSTATAFYVQRPLLDRVVLVASSIPVALLSNVVRIVVTGMLDAQAGSHEAFAIWHRVAGWFMIPLAMALYWCEITLLAHLLRMPEQKAPMIYGLIPAEETRTRVPETIGC